MADFTIGDYQYTIISGTTNVSVRVVDTTKISYEDIPATVSNNGVTYTITQLVDTNDTGCFENCSNLIKAPIIPNTVTNMNWCFHSCASLTTVPIIPNSVTTLENCFTLCTSLVIAPIIPHSVTDMKWCFNGCTSLTTISIISNSLTDMSYCFYNCTSLTTIPIIPNSVTNMSWCFYGCTSLTTVPIIPNAVVGLQACFRGCTSLFGNIKAYNNPTNQDGVFTNTVKPITVTVKNLSALSTWQTIANNYSNVIVIPAKGIIKPTRDGLQVWLPLNTNLTNYGASNLTFSNLNSTYTTINNNGKTGKCYTNSSYTEGGLVSSGTLALGQQQSMFCWFKFTALGSSSTLGGSLVTQHRYSSNQGMGLTLRYASANTAYLAVNTGDGTNRTYVTYYHSTLLQKDTWYHGGYTYNNGQLKLYINGVCGYSGNIGTQQVPADYFAVFAWGLTGTSGNGVLSNYKLQGGLNDVRIYSRVLPQEEIYGLMRDTHPTDLIVHYPLNNNGVGVKHPNLLFNTYSMPVNSTEVRGFRLSGTGTVTHIDYDNLPMGTGVIRITNGTSAAANGGIAQDSVEGFEAGQKYSQSCWVRSSTNSITDFYFQPIWASSSQTTGGGGIKRFTLTTEWQYLKLEGVVLSGAQACINPGGHSAGYAYATIPAGEWIEFCGMKVELGEEATPWEPHRFDALTPYMKYDNAIYTEPDGSKWLRIAHHNNPGNARFASTDDFYRGVYLDSNRWYNAEQICYHLSRFEFMVKQTATSGGVESKYRWVQYTNLVDATWEDVQPSSVKRITTTGYTDGGYGGIYKRNSNARLCIANANNGNWYGSFGTWTLYNSGTPGYPNTVVTTGYMDLYVRIDGGALEPDMEYDISGCDNDAARNIALDNLFIGSRFTPDDRKQFAKENVTDNWNAYLRYYNGAASNHSFAEGIDTVTLNSGSNLGICFVRKATEMKLDSTSYYTISCDAKSTQTAKPLCIGLSYYTTANSWTWRGGTNPQNFTAANTWQHFTFTFKPDADTQYIGYCFTVVGTSNGTNTFSIKNCKLEKGSTATPYTMNIQDWYNESKPKYKSSTYFRNFTYYLSKELNYVAPSEVTLSCWIKSNNTTPKGGYHLILNIGSTSYELSVYAATGQARFGLITGGTRHVSNVGPNILDGQWHMLTVTYDGSSIKRYVDAGLVNSESATGLLNPLSMLSMGNFAPGTDTSYFDNSYGSTDLCASDARVYARALSENEVISLYNNGATVDADGTIHGQVRNSVVRINGDIYYYEENMDWKTWIDTNYGGYSTQVGITYDSSTLNVTNYQGFVMKDNTTNSVVKATDLMNKLHTYSFITE